MMRPAADLDGFRLWPGLLDRAEQEELRDSVFERLRAGPALRAEDAEVRPADARANDQLRPARLGHR